MSAAATRLPLAEGVTCDTRLCRQHATRVGPDCDYCTGHVRVSVDDQARLAFRLSMPSAERALEAAVADRVEVAKQALGDDFVLLRGAMASS